MKSYLLLILVMMFLVGCDDSKNVQKKPLFSFESSFRHKIVEIDNCEYIAYQSTHCFWEITHKGNCKNIIHSSTEK